jgi:hypothetical protein
VLPHSKNQKAKSKKTAGIFLVFGIWFLIWSHPAQAVVPPSIFFTDLTSGPNSGGENNNGAYVTLYGNNFGTNPNVTVGGGQALIKLQPSSYLWYQKMTIQLNASSQTGNIVLTSSNGTSNAVPFTVRSGNIYCVSTSGSDSTTGKFPSSCWATMANAVGKVGAGDTVYLNGIVETTVGGYSAVVNITGNPGGSSASPIAFVAYPGATATIGALSPSPSPFAIRVPQTGPNPAYYVFAGLTLRGSVAMEPFKADHWWIVGNDMSCVTAGGISCFHADQSTNLFVYGNYVHDIHGDVKLYHAVYFTTNTNHVWAAWNRVDNDPTHSGTGGCRGIQFYSTGGADMYDLHVHDNIVTNTICDGIAMTTTNADLGPIEAYNNVVAHAGTGLPQGSLAHNTCLQVRSSSARTAASQVYNNSLYDCGGAVGSGVAGCFEFGVPVALTNNVCQSLNPGQPYFDSPNNSPCTNVTSHSNNDWYGAGSPPCSYTELNQDPLYTSTASPYNLMPLNSSPLIGAGAAISGLAADIDGVPRPQASNGQFAIGAYEFNTGAPPPPPPTSSPCDVNGDGTTNVADVQLEVNMALGINPCTNASGTCTVVSVQRVVNAALGGTCVAP